MSSEIIKTEEASKLHEFCSWRNTNQNCRIGMMMNQILRVLLYDNMKRIYNKIV